MSKTKNRFYSFDMLKLIAMGIILLHHYQMVAGVQFSSGINWYGGGFYWGWLVELFFILSGFFSYASAIRILDGEGFLRFFGRKYFRFLPLLCICGLATLVSRTLYCRYCLEGGGFDVSLWGVVASLSGIQRWFNSASMINRPMWYVSVLLLCYVVFWFVTKWAGNKKRLFVGYSCMIVVGIVMRFACTQYGVEIPFVNGSISRGYISFFLGLNLAILFDRYQLEDRCLVQIVAAGIVVAFGLLWIYHRELLGENFRYFILVFLVFPGVVLLFGSRAMRSIFKSHYFSSVGGASYNMYLWHMTVLYIFLLVGTLLDFDFDSKATMAAYLGAGLLVGYISSRFLDEPIARSMHLLVTARRPGC